LNVSLTVVAEGISWTCFDLNDDSFGVWDRSAGD
jgi:hypothetical protein